jgi:hypothetical protein
MRPNLGSETSRHREPLPQPLRSILRSIFVTVFQLHLPNLSLNVDKGCIADVVEHLKSNGLI